MSLRILIGHSLPGQRGSTTPLYIGDSGAALESAKAAAGPSIGSFTILNNPTGIRKSNPAYQAPAPIVEDSAPSVGTDVDTKAKSAKRK